MRSRARKGGKRSDFMQIAKGVFDAVVGDGPPSLPPNAGPPPEEDALSLAAGSGRVTRKPMC